MSNCVVVKTPRLILSIISIQSHSQNPRDDPLQTQESEITFMDLEQHEDLNVVKDEVVEDEAGLLAAVSHEMGPISNVSGK